MAISYDTMAAAHLLNEELPLSLLSTCVMELGVDDWGKGRQSFGDGAYPPSPLWGQDGMGTYCATDVAYTHLLYERQRDRLRADQDLAKLLKLLVLPGLEATCRMERNGIWVDQARVEDRKEDMRARLESLREEMAAHVSEDFRETADFGNEHFLRRWLYTPAPSGLGLKPLAFTEKTGKPKVDEATLGELRHPAVDLLMEFRKSTKMLQFFDAWPTWYDPGSRIHPNFNLTGTVTGRRSCDKPNLQQVPRNHLARSCFGAPPGWLMLEFDYSAAEVRIAAWFAGEDALLRVFADPTRDVYRYTAAIIYGKPEWEVTGEERQDAKAVVLGFLYGMSARGFVIYAKQTFGVEFSLEQGEAFRRTYFEAYPKLLPWHERQRRAVAKNRMVTSPTGRARHLMNILSSDRLAVLKAERQAINCVDDETECLAASGWRRWDEMEVGDEILTKNPGTGALEWQAVERLNVGQADEGLVSMESRSFSALVTEGHRWLVGQRGGSKRTRNVLSHRMVETFDLNTSGEHKVHRTGRYEGHCQLPALTDDQVAFLGWVLTDGHLLKGNRLVLSQSQRGNPEKVAEIDALIGRLELIAHRGGPRAVDGLVQWTVNLESSKPLVEALKGERHLTGRLLRGLGPGQPEVLLGSMMAGDGHREEGGKQTFVAKEKRDAEMFAMLAVMCGYSPSLAEMVGRDVPKIYPSMTNAPKGGSYWLVRLNRRPYAYVPEKRLVSGEGITVWCPTVKNGTFVAKRRGTTYITGNSPVQGFGGDLTLASSVSLMGELDQAEILQVGDIHDALLFQVREDVWPKWAHRILSVMESPPALAPFNIHIPVRMKAEGKVSSHWGRMGPLAYRGADGKPTHKFELESFSAPGTLKDEWAAYEAEG
jgi:DNA polymerase I-like protein with 3'-5' exonuclease and polymerase domains